MVMLDVVSVLFWMVTSMAIVLCNSWIIGIQGFHFPCALAILHMLACSCAAAGAGSVGWIKVPAMDTCQWRKSVLPISAAFSTTLVLSNFSYAHLSVPTIQMTKELTVVFVYVLGNAAGTERATPARNWVVGVVVAGTMIATASEIPTASTVLFVQLCAVASEAVRLVLIKKLLIELQGQPFQALAVVAPTTAALLCLPFALTEAPYLVEARQHVHPAWLFFSASLAVLLNMSVYFIVDRIGAVAINVAGVLKNAALIGASAMLYGKGIGARSACGYAIAMAGAAIFSWRSSARAAEEYELLPMHADELLIEE